MPYQVNAVTGPEGYDPRSYIRICHRMQAIKSHYQVDGNDGPWVTFVTGIANDLSMWDAQAAVLERDFRVLRYDLRGQGQTPATDPPYSIDLLVGDLIALWDQP